MDIKDNKRKLRPVIAVMAMIQFAAEREAGHRSASQAGGFRAEQQRNDKRKILVTRW